MYQLYDCGGQNIGCTANEETNALYVFLLNVADIVGYYMTLWEQSCLSVIFKYINDLRNTNKVCSSKVK